MNYDKIIIDTSNVFYRVAAFQLKGLNTSSLYQYLKNNTIVSMYKKYINDIKTHTLGKVCLLFDPLLSEGKLNERSRKKEEYKKNRDNDSLAAQLRIDTLQKLYEIFVLKVQDKVEVYHSCDYEADDFAAKLTETGKCLMITSDEDFAKYLEEGRVEMLKKGLKITEENLYRAKDFEEKHGFKPSITSVIFWKSFYGDPSDNVTGAFVHPSTKVISLADDEMKEILKKLTETKLIDAKRMFNSGTGIFEDLKNLLSLSNTECSYEKLLDIANENFEIIGSLLPRESDINIDKFIIKPIIKETPKTVKRKFSLGGVRH